MSLYLLKPWILSCVVFFFIKYISDQVKSILLKLCEQSFMINILTKAIKKQLLPTYNQIQIVVMLVWEIILLGKNDKYCLLVLIILIRFCIIFLQ